MFSFITDKILTYQIYIEIPKKIPNLTPPLSAIAIKQIAYDIFWQKMYAVTPITMGTLLIGGSAAIGWTRRTFNDGNNGDIELLFGLGVVFLAVGALFGSIVWSRHKNFQQILLPQLKAIANS